MTHPPGRDDNDRNDNAPAPGAQGHGHPDSASQSGERQDAPESSTGMAPPPQWPAPPPFESGGGSYDDPFPASPAASTSESPEPASSEPARSQETSSQPLSPVPQPYQPATSEYPPAGGGYPGPAWGAPTAPIPRQDSKAIGSLIVAVVGLCGLGPLLCCVLPALGGIVQLGCGVAAVVLGIKSRRDIAASQGRLAGEGLAMAGAIVGAVTILAGFLTAVVGFGAILGD